MSNLLKVIENQSSQMLLNVVLAYIKILKV